MREQNFRFGGIGLELLAQIHDVIVDRSRIGARISPYAGENRLTTQDPIGAWTGVVVTVSDNTGELDLVNAQDCEDPNGDPCEQGGRYTLTFVATADAKSYNVNAGFGMDVCITPITLSGTVPTAEVNFTYPPCG